MDQPGFPFMPDVPRAAVWLGGAGLVPFAIGAFALWGLAPEQTPSVLTALIAYGAIILSFMGAVHWGLAMGLPRSTHEEVAANHFYLSVIPSLTGWVAILMPPMTGITVLAAAFAGVYAIDRTAAAVGIAPEWYLQLRTPLTLAVMCLLTVAAAAVGLRLS